MATHLIGFAASGAGRDAFTKLQCSCDGTDGATTFTDDVGVHTITANGNAQVDTAQSKFGGASALFDGTGDYLSVADSSDFDFSGDEDWTIEGWVRFASVATVPLFVGQKSDSSNGFELGWQFSSTRGMTLNLVAAGNYSINLIQNANTGWSVDTWYHVAFDKYGDTYTGFRDGTVIIQTTSANNFANYSGSLIIAGGTQVSISGPQSPSSDLNGWIDELRLSKGVSRYQGTAFTAPTEPFPD